MQLPFLFKSDNSAIITANKFAIALAHTHTHKDIYQKIRQQEDSTDILFPFMLNFI